jgi:hypothetical protein
MYGKYPGKKTAGIGFSFKGVDMVLLSLQYT